MTKFTVKCQCHQFECPGCGRLVCVGDYGVVERGAYQPYCSEPCARDVRRPIRPRRRYKRMTGVNMTRST